MDGNMVAGETPDQAILSCSSPKSAMSLRVPPSAVMKRFRTSWVETSPLSIWETRATETPIRVATYSWVRLQSGPRAPGGRSSASAILRSSAHPRGHQDLPLHMVDGASPHDLVRAGGGCL